MSELSKIVNLALIVSIGVNQIGCVPLPVVSANEKPQECVPLSENEPFSAGIYIHESAKNIVKDVDALCKLVDVLAGAMNAQGRNELTFITNKISNEDFDHVANSVNLKKSEKKHKLDLIRNNYIGGFAVKMNGITKSVIIIDEDDTVSLEEFLIEGIATETGHSYDDGLPLSDCSVGDLDDVMKARSIRFGVLDKNLNRESRLNNLPNIQINCPNGISLNDKVNADLYDWAYKWNSEGLTLFGMASKVFGK